jgi:hypothetical protein
VRCVYGHEQPGYASRKSPSSSQDNAYLRGQKRRNRTGVCPSDVVAGGRVSYRGWASSPPAAARAVGPLREDIAEQRVVLVLVHVVNAYVSPGGSAKAGQIVIEAHTVADYQAVDTCALYRDRKDIRIQASRVPDRAGSSRSCA